MERLPTRLAGLVLLQPRIFPDERGYFLETYNRDRYRDVGITADFVQDNHSRSRRGAVRGLHFQRMPGQPKLVRCAHGRVFDVVVDIRRGSPTFGEWEGFELNDTSHRQLFVPIGFAHGLQALEDDTDFVYKVGSQYDPVAEVGIRWDDPELAISWPIRPAIVTERDAANPTLREAEQHLPNW
ncbi:MAG: dTDP-4-dehydrorhamnose 3,5-epimerase [Erythrobacter sp.]|nr:dTDP-4-dehydrorhamnose 3,5-epimerase [Erythrobacter sp.]